MRRALVIALAVALPAVLPGAASAQTRCLGPPGQGAIDQYCELVPSGGGSARKRPPKVSAQVQRELQQAGADGEAVEILVQSSPAPVAVARKQKQKQRAASPQKSRDAGSGAGASVSPAPTSSLLDAVRDGAGLGASGTAWLPFLLLASALAAAGLAWSRRGDRS